MVDQGAVGEAHVRLEALHPALGETRPERRHVAGEADLDPEHRLAPERQERDLRDVGGGRRPPSVWRSEARTKK